VSLTDLPPAIRTSNPGSFAQATGYFPAPLAALRTLKPVVNPDVRGRRSRGKSVDNQAALLR
jgi:hypothetical protein